MAQPIFQPIVNEANAPTYIRPGVVDGSAGVVTNAIGSLIPGAIRGYEGYQLGKLRAEQDKNIAALEASHQAEKDEREATASILGQTSQIENIWDSFDSGVDKMDTVNTIEKEIKAQGERLAAAKAQGRITDARFLAENTKIVREAINRNPWMEAEIYGAAQRHLSALGITDALTERAKAEKALADNDEQTMKFYRQAYKDANMLHKFNPNAGEGAWQQELSSYGERKAKIDGLKDFLESDRTMNELQLEQALTGGRAWEFHNLETEDFEETLIRNLEQQSSPQDYDKIIAAAKLQKATRMRQYREKLGSGALTDKGKTFLSDAEKDYDTIINTLVEAGNGKNGAERLGNRLELRKAEQALELRSVVNPEGLDLLSKVMTSLGSSLGAMLRESGEGSIKSLLKKGLSLMDPNNMGSKQQGDAVSSGAPQLIVGSILDHKEGWANRDNQTVVTTILRSTNDALSKGAVDPKAGVRAINGVLKSVAQNAQKFKGVPVNPEFARQVGAAVDISMRSTVKNTIAAIKEVMDNPANKGAKHPEMDVLADGSFIIKTDDPEADNKFNSIFSSLINNSLDSYAASLGADKRAVAAEFYNKYLRIYVAGDPDLEALGSKNPSPKGIEASGRTQNPLPVTGKRTEEAAKDLNTRLQKAKADFKNKKIDQSTYDNILRVLKEEGARLAEADRRD